MSLGRDMQERLDAAQQAAQAHTQPFPAIHDDTVVMWPVYEPKPVRIMALPAVEPRKQPKRPSKAEQAKRTARTIQVATILISILIAAILLQLPMFKG